MTERERERETKSQRELDRKTDRERETQTKRERNRDREIDRQADIHATRKTDIQKQTRDPKVRVRHTHNPASKISSPLRRWSERFFRRMVSRAGVTWCAGALYRTLP